MRGKARHGLGLDWARLRGRERRGGEGREVEGREEKSKGRKEEGRGGEGREGMKRKEKKEEKRQKKIKQLQGDINSIGHTLGPRNIALFHCIYVWILNLEPNLKL